MEFGHSSDKKTVERLDDWFQRLLPKLKLPNEAPDDGDYKKPYLILFNGITDALDSMERLNFGRARDILQDAQQAAEEAYISVDDNQ